MNVPEKASSFGLSLASRLCSIVNDSPATSVETVLAEYLLQHYNTLDTLNIYQFAEACRVPAAVSIGSAGKSATPISASSSSPAAGKRIPTGILRSFPEDTTSAISWDMKSSTWSPI